MWRGHYVEGYVEGTMRIESTMWRALCGGHYVMWRALYRGGHYIEEGTMWS